MYNQTDERFSFDQVLRDSVRVVANIEGSDAVDLLNISKWFGLIWMSLNLFMSNSNLEARKRLGVILGVCIWKVNVRMAILNMSIIA